MLFNMSHYLLQNVRVFDPSLDIDRVADVEIAQGKILAIASGSAAGACNVAMAHDQWVVATSGSQPSPP